MKDYLVAYRDDRSQLRVLGIGRAYMTRAGAEHARGRWRTREATYRDNLRPYSNAAVYRLKRVWTWTDVKNQLLVWASWVRS